MTKNQLNTTHWRMTRLMKTKNPKYQKNNANSTRCSVLSPLLKKGLKVTRRRIVTMIGGKDTRESDLIATGERKTRKENIADATMRDLVENTTTIDQ